MSKIQINTSEHIRNVSYALITQENNIYHKKKWVAVDDLLNLSKIFRADGSVLLKMSNEQFWKLEGTDAK